MKVKNMIQTQKANPTINATVNYKDSTQVLGREETLQQLEYTIGCTRKQLMGDSNNTQDPNVLRSRIHCKLTAGKQLKS